MSYEDERYISSRVDRIKLLEEKIKQLEKKNELLLDCVTWYRHNCLLNTKWELMGDYHDIVTSKRAIDCLKKVEELV